MCNFSIHGLMTDFFFFMFQVLLIQESRWKLPHLLQLPENYNTIFQYYHRKTCSVCTKVPKDPAVCLVCGTFVCLKGLCCKQQSYCECVLVSNWQAGRKARPGECGAVKPSALQSESNSTSRGKAHAVYPFLSTVPLLLSLAYFSPGWETVFFH